MQIRRTYDRDQLDALGLAGVRLFGYQKFSGAAHVLPDHSHPQCIEICFLATGRQCFSVDGRDFWMRGGQVFMTYPGETHSTGGQPMEKGELFWLIIDLSPRKDFLGLVEPTGNALQRTLVKLSLRLVTMNAAAAKDLAALEHILRCGSASSPVAAHRHILSFLDMLVDACKTLPEVDDRRFEAVLNYISHNLHEPIRVAQLAREFGTSESRFKSVFKEVFGVSATEYIARARVDRAKRDLRTTSATVTDIAYSLGFSTPQYFANVFRRYTGASPQAYRGTHKDRHPEPPTAADPFNTQ